VVAGDGVADPDVAQPRRGGREDEIADEGKSAREQECGANEREGGGTTLVQPEQHADGDGEVKRQIGEAEHVDQARERVSRALNASLDENVQ
jgi:hypothetical protein